MNCSQTKTYLWRRQQCSISIFTSIMVAFFQSNVEIRSDTKGDVEQEALLPCRHFNRRFLSDIPVPRRCVLHFIRYILVMDHQMNVYLFPANKCE